MKLVKILRNNTFKISSSIILSILLLLIVLNHNNLLISNVESTGVPSYPECAEDTLDAQVVRSWVVNPDGRPVCDDPLVRVVNPELIQIYWDWKPDYPSGWLCVQVYDVWFHNIGDTPRYPGANTVGWWIRKCHTGTCVVERLHHQYVGTFDTGPLEDTRDNAGNQQPDYAATIRAILIPAVGCCGNGDLDPGEECEIGGITPGGGSLPVNDCTPSTTPGACQYCQVDSCKVRNKVVGDVGLPLTVTGGLVALGNNITGTGSALVLNRDIKYYYPFVGERYYTDTQGYGFSGFNNNLDPAEEITYDPRYLDIYKHVLGRIGFARFTESGVN